MSTTIEQEGNKLNPDTYVELFTFDFSSISGGLIEATIVGVILTVTKVPIQLSLAVGMSLSSFNLLPAKIVNQLTGTSGKEGTYTINVSQTFPGATEGQTYVSKEISITSNIIMYYTNTSFGGTNQFINILWQGHQYLPLPFEVTGIDNKGDGSALSRPTISLSNLSKTLMLGVLSLGNLIGMKVTRCRTFYKFTDNGTEPNNLTHFPLEIYFITRKVVQNKTSLQFELSSTLDRAGLKLPRRQVLRDGDGRVNSAFPGVSRVRVR